MPVLANDVDPDAGTTLTIAAIDDSQTLGTLVFDPATQSLRYVADDDSFDDLAPGEVVTDRFTYTVRDAEGLTSTATVVSSSEVAKRVFHRPSRPVNGNVHRKPPMITTMKLSNSGSCPIR